MARKSGFTVIELLSITALLIVVGAVFFIQFNAVNTAQRDDRRRTAINAMYYNLEKVYAPRNNNKYPKSLSEKILPGIDPALFTDPDGFKLGDSSSNYRYVPVGCQENSCSGYTLRADLEAEADFIKKSSDSK